MHSDRARYRPAARLEAEEQLALVELAERRRTPDQRQLGPGQAREHVEQVRETEQIVLEPEHDFVARGGVVEELLLLDEARAHAEEVFAERRGERLRAGLDPILAGRHAAGEERVAGGAG